MAGTNTMLTPKSEAEATAMIAAARTKGSRLEIIGNGTKRAVGNAVDAAQTISSSKLSGIVQYNPAELVMVAKAGTPMSEINKALTKNKQMHVFEPADWTAMLGIKGKQTIGGIAATNMSGPRRFVAGAARDSLLGVRFVNGKGEIIKNGGQVMKNVTGLDLVRLLSGSWGTLGLLTEVSFKVLPLATAQSTLVFAGLSDADAAALMAKAMATSADVSGAAHLPKNVAAEQGFNSAITVLRLEGLPETIPVRRDRLLAALDSKASMNEVEGKVSGNLWASIRDVMPFADGTQKPVWRISVAPMSGHAVVADILADANGDAFYDWQGGLVWLRLDDVSDVKGSAVRSAIAKHGGGHATLIRASEAVRQTIPVFHPETAPVAAMSSRIKAALDPDGLFNIGRMVPNNIIKAA